MSPAGTPEIIPFPKSEPDRRLTDDGPLVATHLTIVCQCSDGKLRAIEFKGKQAQKIYGYVEHIQGGRVKMRNEPLLLVYDTDVVRQAVEAAISPKPQSLGQKIRTGLTGFLGFRKSNPVNPENPVSS